jgi:threonine dehydrogenase-like Zn-dependent dehydrogenase
MSPPSEPSSVVRARIATLTAPRTLEWREEDLPAVAGPGELHCRTVASAISPGTELAAWNGLPPLRPVAPYPRVQGYCNVAEVLQVGPGVRGFVPGDRVLSFQSHRSAFRLQADEVLVKLDPTADPARQSVAYLFHLGYEAVLRSGVRPGSRVLVIGAGALGLGSVAMAQRAGARVAVVTQHPAAAATARRLGATGVLSRDDGTGLADFQPDVIVHTTNAWADWRLALEAAATRTTIAVLGFPGRGEAAADFNPLASQWFYAKQLRVEAVGLAPERPDSRGLLRFNERDNLTWLCAEIATGRLDADALVSGRYAGADLAAAYEALRTRRGSPVTYVLDWT